MKKNSQNVTSAVNALSNFMHENRKDVLAIIILVANENALYYYNNNIMHSCSFSREILVLQKFC